MNFTTIPGVLLVAKSLGSEVAETNANIDKQRVVLKIQVYYKAQIHMHTGTDTPKNKTTTTTNNSGMERWLSCSESSLELGLGCEPLPE